jgi:hypothetical protein
MPFSIPPFLTRFVPPPGTLYGPHIKILSDMTQWFDGPHLVRIATDGVDFESSLPPGARPHSSVPMWRGSSEEYTYFRDNVIEKGLRCGHLRRVRADECHLAVIHPCFLIPKHVPDGMPKKFRDIINFAQRLDLRQWNRDDLSFNDSTPLQRRPSVSPGRLSDVSHILAHMVLHGIPKTSIHIGKLDLAEAYKHIHIAKHAQLQQSISFNNVTYAATAMQFGTAASSCVWCRVINLIHAAFKFFGIGCGTYIDDILSIGASKAQETSSLALQRAILRFCGIKANEDKSDHHGQRCRDFVGILIDLDTWSLSILPRSADKLRARCHELLRRSLLTPLADCNLHAADEVDTDDYDTTPSCKADFEGPPDNEPALKSMSSKLLLTKLAGSMNFAASVIRPMKPMKAYIYALSKVASPQLGSRTACYMRTVLAMMDTSNSSPIMHPPYELARQHDMCLASDASSTHFGAVGVSRDGSLFYIQEAWEDMHPDIKNLRHINDQELLAHLAMVAFLLPHVGPEYRVIPTLADNTATVSWINRLYARLEDTDDDTVSAQAQRCSWISGYAIMQHRMSIFVTTSYITSVENILPDALSRPLTHQHIFNAYATQLQDRGLSVTHVRIPHTWLPPGYPL